MKEVRIGSFIFTNTDCGIVKRVGINCVEYDNNVNVVKASFQEITDVI